jgi:hypothetical protein
MTAATVALSVLLGTTTVHADGDTIRGSLIVASSASRVRAALADGAALAATSPEVRAATARPQGACEALRLEVSGLFSPFEVHTLRCPTANGWTETLIESSMFSAWETSWTVTPTADGGARIDYAVRTALDLPVPASLVRDRTARSVRICLDRVEARLAATADAVAAR